MLDASKAYFKWWRSFVKVNLLLLFNQLRLKGRCPLLLRFIINMYIGQNIRVKWNDCLSHVYAVSNGVKQGGVFFGGDGRLPRSLQVTITLIISRIRVK